MFTEVFTGVCTESNKFRFLSKLDSVLQPHKISICMNPEKLTVGNPKMVY